jgi:hypothetical protein
MAGGACRRRVMSFYLCNVFFADVFAVEGDLQGADESEVSRDSFRVRHVRLVRSSGARRVRG